MIRFLIALCFATTVIGGCMLYLGLDTLDNVAKLDADWEKVTLRQWLDGETENKTLFEISEFKAGEHFVSVDRRRSDDYAIVYMPLYLPEQKEGYGKQVQVVVGVRDARNDEELWNIMDQPVIKVQDYQSDPPIVAKELSAAYPELDWDKIRWAVVDAEPPTAEFGTRMVGIGVGSLFAGLATAICSIVLWIRNASSTKKDYTTAVAELESTGNTKRSEVGHSGLASAVSTLTQYSNYVFTPLIFINGAIALLYKGGAVDFDLVQILYFTVPACLLTGVFVLLSHFFVAPVLQLESKSLEELDDAVLRKLTRHIESFQANGYHLIGYSKSRFMSTKYQAYLLSSDRKRLVEIATGGHEFASIIIGITDDGMLFQTGQNSTDVAIDGTKNGVPLIAKCWKKCSISETIASFEEFEQLLQTTGSRLLTIDPESVFHVMHYEVILVAWWAYQSSLRFSKPEPLPSLPEVTADGQKFTFGRNQDFDDAYSSEDFDSNLADANEVVPVMAAAGGEELVSAKYFNMQ